MHAVINFGPQQILHICNIYGFTNAWRDRQAQTLNEPLLRQALQHTAELGNAPCLICGDLNTNSEFSACLGESIATGRYWDAAELWAMHSSEPPQTTCLAREGVTPSRIDLMLINSVAASSFRKFAVVPDSGLPTHRPVGCCLELQALERQAGERFHVPKNLPLGWQDPQPTGEQQAEDWATTIACSTYEAWQACLQRADVDEALAMWSADLERYIWTRATGSPSIPRQHAGRGREPRLVKHWTQAEHSSPELGAETMAIHRKQKLTRRVEELVHKLMHRDVLQPLPREWWHIWDKCRHDGHALLDQPGFRHFWSQPDIPDLNSLRQLSCRLRQCLAAEQDITRVQRRTAWKEWTQTCWRESKSGGQSVPDMKRRTVYDLLRDDPQSHGAPILRGVDGHFTGSPAEVDELLRDAWLPIFQLYQQEPEPSFAHFKRRWGQYFPAHQPLTMGDICPDDLWETLSKMSTSSATGVDGWSVAELRHMPPELLFRLCELLGKIEELGQWPSAIRQGLITPVPKGKGLVAGEMRPITIMSVLYRLWAATRMRALAAWQEQWAGSGIYAYRSRTGCDDLYWSLALEVEHALLSGDDVSGISLDYEKAFDRLPVAILMGLAAHIGLSQCALRPLEGMYRSLERRWKLGPVVGRSFVSTNGILQGCPLSVLLLNMIVRVWCTVIEVHVPSVKPRAYADDAHLVGGPVDDLRRALNWTLRFAYDTGQKVHTGKTKGWSTSPDFRRELSRLTVGDNQLTTVLHDRVMGT